MITTSSPTARVGHGGEVDPGVLEFDGEPIGRGAPAHEHAAGVEPAQAVGRAHRDHAQPHAARSPGNGAASAKRSRGVSSLSAMTRVASASNAGRSGTGGVSPGNVMP